jgi:DNA-binding MarR family transcriptional regulator
MAWCGEEHMAGSPADSVVDALLRASRALVTITSRSLRTANADVTLPQFRTLAVLATRGPQTVSVLADHLSVHASTMTRMCSRLVARGLVARAPSGADRREVVITLTAGGTSLVETVTQARRRELDSVVGTLSETERHALIGALDAFTHAAGSDHGPFDADSLASDVHTLGASPILEV